MREIVEQFIDQIELDQKFSSNTKAAYRSDLNELIDYIIVNKTKITDIDQAWVKNYLKHLEETNNERNSYNRRASTFRSFLKFLYRNKMAPTNYSLIVDNQSIFFKTQEEEPPLEEIKNIINDNKLKIDQRLILQFIGRLGLTATQIVSSKTFQVDFENRSISISDTEKIELPHEIFITLREYLLEVRPNQAGADDLHIFLNEKGRALNESDIYRLIKKLSSELSLEGKLTARNLKKSLENKTDILSMQREIFNVVSPR